MSVGLLPMDRAGNIAVADACATRQWSLFYELIAKDPQLVRTSRTETFGHSCAHFAAASGRVDVLEWIVKQANQQTEEEGILPLSLFISNQLLKHVTNFIQATDGWHYWNAGVEYADRHHFMRPQRPIKPRPWTTCCNTFQVGLWLV